jgi:hypothetical protein
MLYKKSNKQRTKKLRFSQNDPSNNESREVSKSQQVQREKAMVKTLICLALSFVVLTLPANIFYFLIVFASQIEKNYLLVI